MTIYSADAIADSHYMLAPTNPARDVIGGLKSYDWYIQNPAIDQLNTALLSACDNDTLFVLGRNIYQAAVGSARSASHYLRNFRSKVQSLEADKAKALLDGMLFEIFFNSKGEIRKEFKISLFNRVFDLKEFPDFSHSFEFISEVLISHQNRFYVIPGKSRDVNVDVSTTHNSDGEIIITAIFFEGFNILRKLDDPMAMYFRDTATFYPITFDQLKEQISKEMIVPLSQITLNSTSDISSERILGSSPDRVGNFHRTTPSG